MKSNEKGCPDEHPLIFAPGRRDGCLPDGEARGGDFALGDVPHPYSGLNRDAKIYKNC